MRNAVLSAVLGLLPLLAAGSAQAQSLLLSSRSFDGAGGANDAFYAAAAAPGGGYYLAGYSSSPATNADIWLVRVDASLNLVSSTTLDGAASGFDGAYGVAVGSGGIVYAVGVASASPVGIQHWLGRFTADLALISSTTFTGGVSDVSTSLDAIAVEPSGNLLVVGDIYPSIGSPWSTIWLARYSPELVLLATRTFSNGFASESAASLLLSGSGDVYVGGGIAPAALTSHNLWIGKFNNALVLQASTTFAGSGGNTDQARGLTLGSNGDLYATGIMNNSGVTVDAWIARYTTSLVRVSSRSISGIASANDSGSALALGPAGTVILGGSLSQTGQSENLLIGEIHENNLTVKSTATVASAGAGVDIGHAVVVDTAAGVALLAGYIAGASRDGFIARYAVSAPALTSITLSPSTAALALGTTIQLTAVAVYSGASTSSTAGSTWNSDAPFVATVTVTGLVRALSPGTAVITISSGAVTAQAIITVSGSLALTSIAPSSGTAGTSTSFAAAGTLFDGSSTLTLERLAGAPSRSTGPALSLARANHETLLLDDSGKLLVIGGQGGLGSSITATTALLDPLTNTWSAGPSMAQARYNFTATKLRDGRVLVSGGHGPSSSYLSGAEIYDPVSNSWSATGSLATGRDNHMAALLPDGRVLIAGGYNGVTLASCEVWSPATGAWSTCTPMATARQTAVFQLLSDGRVLTAGGDSTVVGYTATAEIYTPATNSWSVANPMSTPRASPAHFLLADGRVLVTGGVAPGPSYPLRSDIFDPASGTWTQTSSMSAGGYGQGFTFVDGRPTVFGGMGSAYLSRAESYDLADDSWRALPGMSNGRVYPRAARLKDGRILVTGGEFGPTSLSSVDVYSAPGATITATGLALVSSMSLTGSLPLSGAATGYWDVVVRSPAEEARLPAGFRVRSPSLTALAVSPSSAALEAGAQLTLAAIGTFDNASTQTFTGLVVWSSSPTAVASVSTSGVVTALSAGTALITASSGSVSGSALVTVAILPSPTGFTGVAAGTTTVQWSWTDTASGELGYRVMGGTVSVSGDLSAGTTVWLQGGLTPNTLYGPYLARVFNSSGTADSSTTTRRTLAAAPAGTAVSSFSATAATITWTLNGNPAGLTAEVHRSTDNAVFALLNSTAATFLRDASLLGCTSYYYKVRNLNGDAVATTFDATVLVRTADTTPAPPAALTAEAAAGGRVALAWTGSPTEGITGYRLYFDAGTGAFNYGAPLAVLTSTESAYATGVLASSAAYAFALRAVHRCGVEEATGVFASAASTATLAAVRAAIKHPDSGKRIRGNRVTVMAELTSGTPDQVSQVRFEYRASTTAPWIAVPAANPNHPNPDLQAPYFVHWDVSALAGGDYHLRAVAFETGGGADPAPGSIVIRIVGAAEDCDIEEDEIGGEIRKRQNVNNGVVNTVASGGKDAGDPLAKIVLPAGAVSDSTATITVESNPTITTSPPSGLASVGSFLRVNLSNGQHNLSNGQVACITMSYGSNVTDPSRLVIYSLDEATGIWSRDFATTVNASSRTATGCTPHFSIFAVFQGIATATLLDGVRLYPNPYKPNGGNSDEGKPFSLGDDTTGIIFDQLPAAVTIDIYSLTGRRVARFDTTASGGKIRWDVRTSDGRDAAAGGYFAVISSPGLKSAVKKFIIIR